jgi:methionyl-tRNA formyltransferase
MRVVFMGTPEFAVPSLHALAAEHEVVGVYTAPDRPAGRGLNLRPSPVKVAAVTLGIPVFQPATLRDPSAVETLAALRPDLIAVAAYGLILPPAVLDAPRFGALNVHASLLPRWRGAAPIERAILAGESLVGVSIMRMEEGLDTGPFAMQVVVPAGVASSEELRCTLAEAGARVLMAVIGEVAAGCVVWTSQDESAATYAAKITRADVALSPNLSVAEAIRRVRASGTTASSRAVLDGKAVSVQRLISSGEPVAPGRVFVNEGGLLIGLADGTARVERLTPAGKGPMDGASFARGARLSPDARWEATR